MAETLHSLLQKTVDRYLAPGARLLGVAERDGPQGFSGAVLRYFDVTYTHDGQRGSTALVTKDAPLHERHTAVRLSKQQLPGIPFAYAPDLESTQLSQMCMQEVAPDEDQAPAGLATYAAAALAGIHAANMGYGAEMPWLPRADHTYFAEWLVEGCCLRMWRHMFSDEAFDYGFGGHWPAPDPGSGEAFNAAFGQYREPLERAATRFIADMDALLADTGTLTLVNADLHDNHVLVHGGRPYLIDWGQARYGPLDIDLPNYFGRDEALHYRDALAALGHDIPHEDFLARYDNAVPYVGFKYFGIGLWNWRYNGRDDANVWHFLKLIIGA